MQSDVMHARDLTAGDATGWTQDSVNYSCMGRFNDFLKRGPEAVPLYITSHAATYI